MARPRHQRYDRGGQGTMRAALRRDRAPREVAVLKMTKEECAIIEFLERDLGRPLTAQEIFLSLLQARQRAGAAAPPAAARDGPIGGPPSPGWAPKRENRTGGGGPSRR